MFLPTTTSPPPKKRKYTKKNWTYMYMWLWIQVKYNKGEKNKKTHTLKKKKNTPPPFQICDIFSVWNGLHLQQLSHLLRVLFDLPASLCPSCWSADWMLEERKADLRNMSEKLPTSLYPHYIQNHFVQTTKNALWKVSHYHQHLIYTLHM